MTKRFAMIPAVLFGALLTGCASAQPALVPDGRALVNAQGESVWLRGVNLGNWFMLEPWMLGIYDDSIPDDQTVRDILASRFGDAESERLLDVLRENWLTERDFQAASDAGFNAVRVPLRHVVFERDEAPFQIREDSFRWLDRVFELAGEHGLFVILDMHSAPGGQSLDRPSGDVTENNLWGNAENIDRLAWLWQRIARRYKNEPSFVAYDLLNEPYGDFDTDLREDLVEVMERSIQAIRTVDQERLIFAPGGLEGVAFYGDPAARGWQNVGFTEHFYPGLFDGRPPSLGTHARFDAHELGARDVLMQDWDVPYLVGEFNPIWERAGGARMTRWTFDRAEAREMHATMWALKVLTPSGAIEDNNWPVVTNAEPFSVDLRGDSLAQIEQKFRSLSTMALETDAELASELNGVGGSLDVPAAGVALFGAPASDTLAGWAGFDIGEVGVAGGLLVEDAGDGDVTLYSGGLDVFGTADSTRVLASTWSGNSFVSATLADWDAYGRFAEAGVMLRASEDPASPHLFLGVRTDGTVTLKSRSQPGAGTSQRVVGVVSLPAGVALGRIGSSYVAYVTDSEGQWSVVPVAESPNLGGSYLAGVAASSNTRDSLGVARFEDLVIGGAISLPSPLALPGGGNLLSNSSYESPAAPTLQSVPQSWSLSGGFIGREVGWTPTRSGNSLLAYRHWQSSGGGPSIARQTVSGLTPGQRYEYSAFVNRDDVTGAQADRMTIRIETLDTPSLVLEERSWSVGDLATGSSFSRVGLEFAATGPAVRVSMQFFPASGGNRDGAVKVDDARLRVVTE
ncbi:MAG: cellulase family glycosylhydrolase [Planctomycetota bacterium]